MAVITRGSSGLPGINHKRLSEIRDYEYPNTVKGHSSTKPVDADEDFSESYRKNHKNDFVPSNDSNSEKTVFYDGNLRRI